jgi:hypothetical protein
MLSGMADAESALCRLRAAQEGGSETNGSLIAAGRWRGPGRQEAEFRFAHRHQRGRLHSTVSGGSSSRRC